MLSKGRAAQTAITSLLVLFCTLCCATDQVRDGAVTTALAPAGRPWDSQSPFHTETDTLLVASLDGSLHALDAQSGHLKWSFSSGAPLLSSVSQHKEGYSGVDGETLEKEGLVFPGADGSLYAYRRGHGVQKLPLSARQLVDASPSLGHDGAIVVGARHSTIFVVDAATGNLIRKYDGRTGQVTPEPGLANENVTTEVGDVEDCFYVGSKADVEENADSAAARASEGPSGMHCHGSLYLVRTDYSVKSMDAASGIELWNVSVGELSTLYNPTTPWPLQSAGGQTSTLDLSAGNEGSPSLQMLDPISGQKQWETTLPAPPVAVFSPSGALLKELLPSSQVSGQNQGGVFALPRPREAPPKPLPPQLMPASREEVLVSPGCEPGDLLCNLEQLGRDNRSGQRFAREEVADDVAGFLAQASVALGAVVVAAVFGALAGRFFWGRHSQSGAAVRQHLKSSGGKKKKPRKQGADKAHENGLSSAEATASEGRAGSQQLDTRVLRRGDGGAEEGLMRVGRLLVSQKVIGYGSHGTVVLEGSLEGRRVAVKRLLAQFYDRAEKEIANLILSDEHPNVVRCYAMEEDVDFVYLALERCKQSLSDLILGVASSLSSGGSASAERAKALQAGELLPTAKDLLGPPPPPQGHTRPGPGGQEWVLWDVSDRPSEKLVSLMRDLVAGLAHLHSLGIVHRDLKPQNVLLSANGRAKLSDMGISKRLAGEQSSFDPHATGAGTSGWQAPEQLLEGRQTRAVDLFSLGCVLFFCLTGGRHPYGERFERDSNVLRNQPDLFPLEHLPEGSHLVGRLLDRDPAKRPTALEALAHPLFWSAEQKLSFLRDASDRVELEDREAGSQLFADVEAVGPRALGGAWDAHLDQDLIDNLGKYRRYNCRSVRDLLRVIRNKSNHFRELPQHVQELLGPVPEGFVDYFTTRFPHLLLQVYMVLQRYCKNEDIFRKYYHPATSLVVGK